MLARVPPPDSTTYFKYAYEFLHSVLVHALNPTPPCWNPSYDAKRQLTLVKSTQPSEKMASRALKDNPRSLASDPIFWSPAAEGRTGGFLC